MNILQLLWNDGSKNHFGMPVDRNEIESFIEWKRNKFNLEIVSEKIMRKDEVNV